MWGRGKRGIDKGKGEKTGSWDLLNEQRVSLALFILFFS